MLQQARKLAGTGTWSGPMVAEHVRVATALMACDIGLPLVVLPAIALVIGSGALVRPSRRRRLSARHAIESDVRCPSCIDVSVAQSNESTALAVRHEIQRQVARGALTSAQIEQTLVSQYGSQTILPEPPDSGGFAVIWIVTIAAGASALGVIGALLGAARDSSAADRARADYGGHAVTTEAAVGWGQALDRESTTSAGPSTISGSSFSRSIEDAEREYGSGDLRAGGLRGARGPGPHPTGRSGSRVGRPRPETLATAAVRGHPVR